MAQFDDRRRALRRKYLSLGTGELAAVAVFAYSAVWVITPRLGHDEQALIFMAGVAPLLLVLSQAGAYWLLARRWVTVRPMPRPLARLYRVFETLDVLVLVATGAYVTLHLRTSGGAGALALVVWLFALVEFINYYVVRLSYPWRSWLAQVGQWRTPRLVRDLRAAGVSPH